MPNFSIPLSGLSANSEALSVIANNLANLNTVGYKDQQVAFRDLFYQTLGTNGPGDPLQVGAGAAVGAITADFSSGNSENTGVPTDVAISGDGFFVVQRDGVAQFTRAGNFMVNPAGQLATQDGQLVMGYPAVGGVVDSGQGLGAIQVGRGQLSAPVATSSVQMRTNLDASAAVGSTYTTTLSIYDSLGAPHTLTYQFTKTDANTWDYQISLPAGDVTQANAPVVINQGTLTFDGNGQLTSPSANVSGLDVSNLSDGASALNMTWNLYGADGSPLLNQTAAPNSTASTYQDGYGSGTLEKFVINNDGAVQGFFSNGQSMTIGQLVLANFSNVQGLQRTGQNNFIPSLASGAAVIGAPGSGGRGTLAGGALESSNADIAKEFSKMIINQRGFQANAKVITTFDQITQETINLKQ